MNAEKTDYKFVGTSVEIENALEALARSDKEAEAIASKHQGSMFKGCAGLAVSGLIGVFVYDGINPNSLFSMMIAFIVAAAFLVSLGTIIYHHMETMEASKGDIDDHRLNAVRRLHKLMKVDCAPDAIFDYEVDFRYYGDGKFFLKEEKFGNILFYPRGAFYYYSMPVLTARYKLKDGSTLKISATRNARYKQYKTKNFRGKIKRKSKSKFKDIYRVDLKLPGPAGEKDAVLRVSPPPSEAGHEIKDPRLRVKGNKVTAWRVVKSGSPSFTIEPALRLAVWVFQNLKTARAA